MKVVARRAWPSGVRLKPSPMASPLRLSSNSAIKCVSKCSTKPEAVFSAPSSRKSKKRKTFDFSTPLALGCAKGETTMAGERIKLYSYWRSSAAYRVRIGLNLKGLPYELIPVSLIANGGEHHSEEYRALNPQGKVPTLIDGERIVRQSMAIVEYIEESYEGEQSLVRRAPRRLSC